MRVSIRKHNRSYVERLAAQMECSPNEAINYLLTELRRINYSFGAEATLRINASNTEPERPIEPGQFPMSGLAYINDSDPVIERLVTAGLEEF